MPLELNGLSTVELIGTIVALAVATVAIATDLRHRRIPNALTAPALLAGIAVNAAAHGAAGALLSLGGAGLAFALFLVPYLLGGMGGGDVKLAAALGALFGPPVILAVLAVGALAGGAMALAARRGLLAWAGIGPAGIPYGAAVGLGAWLVGLMTVFAGRLMWP